jgi:hypothetical protein
MLDEGRGTRDEDRNRLKWELGNELERCHQLVWISECNSNRGTDMQQMAAVIEMSDITRAHPNGGRVEGFCFFVSNGLGNAWNDGVTFYYATHMTIDLVVDPHSKELPIPESMWPSIILPGMTKADISSAVREGKLRPLAIPTNRRRRCD